MGTTRRQHSASFKAKVALEALKERETLSELSARFGVAQEMISRWKTDFIKQSSQIFERKTRLSDEPSDEVKRLRSKVGELTMERDFLADACKRSGLKVK
ncbi:MAG: transposase [Rikenellaceae bacterium]